MPVNYQLVPEHSYPSQLVVINDNTEVNPVYAATAGGTSILCVFASPKGHSNEIRTITDGLSGFMREYGLGAFSLYGQPLLNAYAAASSGAATLHCLRVMPNDSYYANATLVAKYKVEDAADGGAKTMTIKYETLTNTALTSYDTIDDVCPEIPEDAGFTAVKLFSIVAQARGVCGNNLRWRITSDNVRDKENAFKNYIMYLYENDGGLVQRESFSGNFIEEATYNGSSIYFDALFANPSNGSDIVDFGSFSEGFTALYDAYKSAYPDSVLTIETFDPLCGIDKTTKKPIEGLVIMAEDVDNNVINPSSLLANGLVGGNDGALAASADPTARATELKSLYAKAFSGDLDPYVKSKRRYPTNLIFDANYDVETKKLIAQLATTRTDCMAVLDMGTAITTKQSPVDYIAQLDAVLTTRQHVIEAYAGKVLDPYSQKNVTVTSTYWLIGALPGWFAAWGGKHKPMAGVNFGGVSGFVDGSLYPVYDEDLDSEIMDELADAHINFLKVNTSQEVVRAIQDTRQERKTVMSEMSNALVLLDIKRDAEAVAETVEFEFADGNLTLFNNRMEQVAAKYAAAQVASITGAFSQNAAEAEMQAIHLNIEFVTKNIVKHALIEIDINR